jgi:hypothetical protein
LQIPIWQRKNLTKKEVIDVPRLIGVGGRQVADVIPPPNTGTMTVGDVRRMANIGNNYALVKIKNDCPEVVGDNDCVMPNDQLQIMPRYEAG